MINLLLFMCMGLNKKRQSETEKNTGVLFPEAAKRSTSQMSSLHPGFVSWWPAKGGSEKPRYILQCIHLNYRCLWP